MLNQSPFIIIFPFGNSIELQIVANTVNCAILGTVTEKKIKKYYRGKNTQNLNEKNY